MLLRIITTKKEYTAECDEEMFGSIMASIEQTPTRSMIHLPEVVISQTYISKSQIISIALEKDNGKMGKQIKK